jgi:hypothetical protein
MITPESIMKQREYEEIENRKRIEGKRFAKNEDEMRKDILIMFKER